jgi:hypothetical protein
MCERDQPWIPREKISQAEEHRQTTTRDKPTDAAVRGATGSWSKDCVTNHIDVMQSGTALDSGTYVAA